MELVSKRFKHEVDINYYKCFINDSNSVSFKTCSCEDKCDHIQKAFPIIFEEFPHLKQLSDVLKETVKDSSIRLFVGLNDYELATLKIEFRKPSEIHVILYLFFEWSSDVRFKINHSETRKNYKLPFTMYGSESDKMYKYLVDWDKQGYVKDYIDKNHFFTDHGFFAKPADFHELTHAHKAVFRCCTQRHPLLIAPHGSGKTEAVCAFLQSQSDPGFTVIICPKTSVEGWVSNRFLTGCTILKICNNRDIENYKKTYESWTPMSRVPTILIVSINIFTEGFMEEVLQSTYIQTLVLDHVNTIRENKLVLLKKLHYKKTIFLMGMHKNQTISRDEILSYCEYICDEIPFGNKDMMENLLSNNWFPSKVDNEIKYPDLDDMMMLKDAPWKYISKFFRDRMVSAEDIEKETNHWEKTPFIQSQLSNQQDCPICFESSNVILKCGHCICVDCSSELESRKVIKCPMCKNETSEFIVIDTNLHDALNHKIDNLPEGRWIIVSSKDRLANYKIKGKKYALSFSGSTYDYVKSIERFRSSNDVVLFVKAPQFNDLDQLLLGVHFHTEFKILFVDYFSKFYSYCERFRPCLPSQYKLECLTA